MNNLPKGFISAEQAIKLIGKHTKSKPIVDIEFLMGNVIYNRLHSAHNATIKLMTKSEDGKYHADTSIFTVLVNTRDLENFKYAIVEKYREVSGRNIDVNTCSLRQLTTQVDDLQGETEVARVNRKSKAKPGVKATQAVADTTTEVKTDTAE